MKICIPVSSPDGLSSKVASIVPQTQYLLLFDQEKRTFVEIDLSLQVAGNQLATEFDVAVCTSISRQIFQVLRQQGKMICLTESLTVEQAIKEFESGELFVIPDEAAACSGSGCHGHESHESGTGGCACQSSGHEGHCHDQGGGGHCAGHGEGQGGCCSGRHATGRPVRKVRGETVRIAVTSQNRKTITEHAGKCRKFWIFEVKSGAVVAKTLLELSLEQSLHSSSPGEVHPLDDVDILITGGIGEGLRQRLESKGIETIVTPGNNPDSVVEAMFAAR